MSRCMLALLMLAISASATAEIRSFPLFSIDVPTEWICDIEERPTPSGLLLQGELISIYRPDGIGVLKMSTYDVPYPVSQDRLRMLTNVPRSTVLEWQERGDFSGYQYSYVENQSFFKQWWLSNEGTILLITYESSDNEPQVEIGTIEEMLNSIKKSPSGPDSAQAPGWKAFQERERTQREEAWRQGRKHMPGTPSWVPIIDTCMEAGGSRNDCIAALPSEEAAKLEAWEQRNRRWRSRGLNRGTFGGQPQLRVPGNSFDWNQIARLPREEAIALAYSSEYSQFRPGILSLVFRFWAEEDPAAAHARLLLLANDFDIAGIEVQIIKRWLLTDASAAIAAAAYSDRAATFEMALRDYAHQDPEAALAATQEYANEMGKAEWTSVIEGVAGRNPRLAAQRVASLGEEGAYLIDGFIGHLIIESPIDAIEWLLAYFPENTDHYDSIASFFFIQAPADAFSYLHEMRDGAAKNAFVAGLCQAKSTNEASRANSGLAQPPPGYAGDTCKNHARS